MAAWYLPNRSGMEPLGPFTQEEIEAKLKSGELRPDEFIWSFDVEELGNRWVRIWELNQFKTALLGYPRSRLPKRRSRGLAKEKAVKKLSFSKRGEYGIENLYRRFPRAPLSCEAWIHNQKNVFQAVCVDINEKGLFLNLPSTKAFDHFKKGEEVVVTLRNAPEIGTISIPSVILREARSDSSQGYGIYFLRINPQVRRKIARYVLGVLEQELSAA